MTIVYNQQATFDDSSELEAANRAQTLGIEPSDDFVVLTQQDGMGEVTHCILVERRDVRALIEALLVC